MIEPWPVYACLAMSLCAAMVGGVFQSFSDFVMRSLSAARDAAGVEVMQMINRKVFSSVFLFTALGLGPALIAASVYASIFLPPGPTAWIVGGSAIYLIAVLLVTIVGNVPMNERLDNMPAGDADTTVYWRHYGRRWTHLNHMRTIGCAIASGCLMIAAVQLAGA